VDSNIPHPALNRDRAIGIWIKERMCKAVSVIAVFPSLAHGPADCVFPIMGRFRPVGVFGHLRCHPHEVDLFTHVAEGGNDRVCGLVLVEAIDYLERLSNRAI
jgi:hypothetical protein